MKLSEGEMVSLAWAVGLQIFRWCISAGEDGCTLEKGTLNPTAEWLDVSPRLNWALSMEGDRKQWHPSTSRGRCWVSAETQSSLSEIILPGNKSFPASILLQSLQLFPQVLVLHCQAGAVGLGGKHGSWNGTLQPQVPKGLLRTALPASLTQ